LGDTQATSDAHDRVPRASRRRRTGRTPERPDDTSFFGHGDLRREDDGAYVMRVASESSLYLRQLSRY
jgi:hypothetical protein